MPKWLVITKWIVGVLLFLFGAGMAVAAGEISAVVFGKNDGRAFVFLLAGFAICWVGTVVFNFDYQKLKRQWIERRNRPPKGIPGDVQYTIWHVYGTSDHVTDHWASEHRWKVRYNAFTVTQSVPEKGKDAKSDATCPHCGAALTLLVGSDAAYRQRSHFATAFLVSPTVIMAVIFAPWLIQWPDGVMNYLQVIGLVFLANLLFDVFLGVFIAQAIMGQQFRVIGPNHTLNAVLRLMK